MRSALPRNETQRSDATSDVSNDAASGDLLVNNLVYKQPAALSLAVARTYSRQFPQKATYGPGETIRFDLNTGSSYLDPENSYLTFKINASPTVVGGESYYNWGCGSAMNLIRSVTIRSRSGTELDRVEGANLWSLHHTISTETLAYLNTTGRVEGWSPEAKWPEGISGTYALFTTGVNYRFCIPLKRLAGFFAPLKKGQKVPPQLASGLQLELILDDYRTSIRQANPGSTGGAITGYTMSSIALMLDAVELTDDTQKTLNYESASNGLEYSYQRVFTATQDVVAGVSSVSQQVRKAVSQAVRAQTIMTPTASRFDINKDSFASGLWDVTRFQYRLGSLYFPQQMIETSGYNDWQESYMLFLETFGKLAHTDKETAVSTSLFDTQASSLCVSLEKDQALNLSGLPINNSRTLELDMMYLPGGFPYARTVTTFLTYVSVSRSYVDNTAVAL